MPLREKSLHHCVDTVTDYKQITDLVFAARDQSPELKQYKSEIGRLSIVKENCHYIYREFSFKLHGVVNAIWINNNKEIVRWLVTPSDREYKNVWPCEKSYDLNQLANFVENVRKQFINIPSFKLGSETESGKTNSCEFWYKEKYFKIPNDASSWVSIIFHFDQNGKIFDYTTKDVNSAKLFRETVELENKKNREWNEKRKKLDEKYKVKL